MDDNKMTDKRIFDAAKENREILINQIDSISPDLVIACGCAVKESLLKEKILIFPTIKKITDIDWNNIIKDEKGRNIIFTIHPTRWSYEDVRAIYKKIREIM